jgi:hypothetical protein
MKKIKFLIAVFLFCVLSSNESYAQASCSGGSSYGSCYVNVGSEGALINDEWVMSCPTGNAYLYAEVNSAEANIWGDWSQLYISNSGFESDSRSLSGLNTSGVHYVGVTIYTPDAGYGYLSVTTW